MGGKTHCPQSWSVAKSDSWVWGSFRQVLIEPFVNCLLVKMLGVFVQLARLCACICQSIFATNLNKRARGWTRERGYGIGKIYWGAMAYLHERERDALSHEAPRSCITLPVQWIILICEAVLHFRWVWRYSCDFFLFKNKYLYGSICVLVPNLPYDYVSSVTMSVNWCTKATACL